jgi:hypothetical protein
MLFILSKLIQTPPLVDVNAPPKLVPPEKAVTAMQRSLHALNMFDTSSVDFGKNTVVGISSGDVGECAVLALESRTDGSDEYSKL